MNKYEIIFESLQDMVNSGDLTLEQANEINDLAYEKYVIEAGLTQKQIKAMSDEQLRSQYNTLDKRYNNYEKKYKESIPNTLASNSTFDKQSKNRLDIGAILDNIRADLRKVEAEMKKRGIM